MSAQADPQTVPQAGDLVGEAAAVLDLLGNLIGGYRGQLTLSVDDQYGLCLILGRVSDQLHEALQRL